MILKLLRSFNNTILWNIFIKFVLLKQKKKLLETVYKIFYG